MKNQEYSNLIVAVGKSWKLRNNLRFKVQRKINEILCLQKEYSSGKINAVDYKMASYILNKEKEMFVKLFKKEDLRVKNK